MEDILIERTDKTPKVHFDYDKGELFLGGISIPENTVDFYHKLMYWVTQYTREPKAKTIVIAKFEYFNTSTSVVLLNIFRMLSDTKTDLEIKWYYEEDDSEMMEIGNDYERMLDVNFNLIPIGSF